MTRGVNPKSPNPYVPWNPIGMLLGPLALISVSYTKKKIKRPLWMVMAILSLTLMSCFYINGCDGWNNFWSVSAPDSSPTETVDPTATTVPTNTATSPGSGVENPSDTVNTGCDGTCTPAPSPLPTATPTLADYGVTLGGTWDADIVLRAVSKVASRLSEKRNNIGDVIAFTEAYGPITFHRSGGDGTCTGGRSRVTCSTNVTITERLLVHELGHTLVQTRYRISLTPYNELGEAQIVDNTPEALGGLDGWLVSILQEITVKPIFFPKNVWQQIRRTLMTPIITFN